MRSVSLYDAVTLGGVLGGSLYANLVSRPRVQTQKDWVGILQERQGANTPTHNVHSCAK